MTVDAAPARAQLIRIETDRRLGHEWDEWDGKPLPGRGDLWAGLPRALWLALGAATGLGWLWFAVLLQSFYGRTRLLPEAWLERGPYLRLMSVTSYGSRVFGKRDWVEHAGIDVYNALAERRHRTVRKGELLVLIPRCLSKEALDGVLTIAGRYEVPVFVATRGQ